MKLIERFKRGDTTKFIFALHDYSIVGFIKARQVRKNNYDYKIIRTDKTYTLCSIHRNNYKNVKMYTCRLVLTEKTNQRI